jgi:hypothetical protein
MSALESLPGDQGAVLQLVLTQGRSYDEIARMLSIDSGAVRARALAALDALGPQTTVDQPARAQICDYLLGQLSHGEIGALRERLAQAGEERAWAQAVCAELAPLASDRLPDIPAEASRPPASEPDRPPGDPDSGPRSSRRGGMVLIALVAAIVAVGVIALLDSGDSKKKPRTIASTPSTAAPPPAAGATTSATTSTAAKVVAQINLTPPAAGSKAAGIAEVLREGTTNGIAIVAQNLAPNSTHPPNAYAVWLYNSRTDARILGFVNPGVPKSGKLSTASSLPAVASHYKQLLVTVETSARPKAPGPVVLQGPLTGV